MLLGRTHELERLEAALAEARAHRGSALLIAGEPGIGKTSLLDHAVAAAGDMTVLAARGVEFEAGVPFAGLHELFKPVFDLIGRLPETQAAALRSSLGLGARIESDRLVVAAATLGLLSVAAENRPLLVVVDDAHWLDPASTEALVFAARRIAADPVAVLLAVRAGEAPAYESAGLAELRVGALDDEAAAQVLRQTSTAPLTSAQVRRLLEATGRNPLALLELAPLMPESGTGESGTPLPLTTSVERAYLRRATGLGEGARRALTLLAAAGAADPRLFARATAQLGIAPDDAVRAERAEGVVEDRGGRLDFVHPLARAAVYHAASPAERRAAHAALAAVTDDPDRRAWHLAAATVEPDAVVAGALAEVGGRARARSAYSAAAEAFAEAARLTPGGDPRAERLVAAAECSWLSGRSEDAKNRLQEAAALATSVRLRAAARGLEGRVAINQGDFERGYQALVEAAEQVRHEDRLQAVRLLGEAGISAYGFGRPGARLPAAQLALELIRPGDPPELAALAHVAYGSHTVLAGRGSDGPAHMREAIDLLRPLDLEAMDPPLLFATGMAGLFLRDSRERAHLLERALAVARERAPTGALPMLLLFLGRDAATTDRWTLAHAHYEEGVQVAAETGQLFWKAHIQSGLAWLEAYEGREAACRADAEEALRLAEKHGMDFVKAWCLTALGQLELGLGRPAAALEHLAACDALLDASGLADPDLSPVPDLVDALVRLGRAPEAAAPLADYRRRAQAKNQPFAEARGWRAEALTASDEAMAEAFESALSYHAATSDTFETARTELFYGERLRRARRRVDARRHLHAALGAFEALGAAPWAARAVAELRAAGETAEVREGAHRLTLTPQELRVAVALAEGLTTREAAAKLYLSPKTVEYHLRNVYDKLEVRSREQLAAALRNSTGR